MAPVWQTSQPRWLILLAVAVLRERWGTPLQAGAPDRMLERAKPAGFARTAVSKGRRHARRSSDEESGAEDNEEEGFEEDGPYRAEGVVRGASANGGSPRGGSSSSLHIEPVEVRARRACSCAPVHSHACLIWSVSLLQSGLCEPGKTCSCDHKWAPLRMVHLEGVRWSGPGGRLLPASAAASMAMWHVQHPRPSQVPCKSKGGSSWSLCGVGLSGTGSIMKRVPVVVAGAGPGAAQGAQPGGRAPEADGDAEEAARAAGGLLPFPLPGRAQTLALGGFAHLAQ